MYVLIHIHFPLFISLSLYIFPLSSNWYEILPETQHVCEYRNDAAIQGHFERLYPNLPGRYYDYVELDDAATSTTPHPGSRDKDPSDLMPEDQAKLKHTEKTENAEESTSCESLPQTSQTPRSLDIFIRLRDSSSDSKISDFCSEQQNSYRQYHKKLRLKKPVSYTHLRAHET